MRAGVLNAVQVSPHGEVINADLNGAINILHIPERIWEQRVASSEG